MQGASYIKLMSIILVQCGENVREGVTFICNCCGCCCEALLAAKKFGNMHPVQTTAFYPSVNDESCVKCGKCEKACPIDAISLIKVENGNKEVVDIDDDSMFRVWGVR